jgi:hypothetical protein
MSPQNAITWADVAQKLILPITASLAVGTLTMLFSETKSLAAEIKCLSTEITQMKVQIAKLETKLEE